MNKCTKYREIVKGFHIHFSAGKSGSYAFVQTSRYSQESSCNTEKFFSINNSKVDSLSIDHRRIIAEFIISVDKHDTSGVLRMEPQVDTVLAIAREEEKVQQPTSEEKL